MSATGSTPKDGESRYRAPALDKGLDILELLADTPGGLTRSEIVKALGRRPSEIYRMLERLVARQYVTRSLEGDRYALTMKLFALGSRHPPTRRLVAQAQPLMDAFAGDSMQSIHLAVPDRGLAIVLAQASPASNWEFRVRIGAQLDMVTTSSGLTLLAYQDRDEREALLTRRSLEPGQIARLRAECAEIHARGYRVGPSQQLAGVRDVSVPLLAPDGCALAVLTVPFLDRLDEVGADRPEACLAALRDVARAVSLGPHD